MEPQLGSLPCFCKTNSRENTFITKFISMFCVTFSFCCHLSLATAAYYPSQKSPVLADNFSNAQLFLVCTGKEDREEVLAQTGLQKKLAY